MHRVLSSVSSSTPRTRSWRGSSGHNSATKIRTISSLTPQSRAISRFTASFVTSNGDNSHPQTAKFNRLCSAFLVLAADGLQSGH
jgi:hypothetical protein